MAGWGTNDGELIEVLGTRTAFELKYAADNYKEKHGKDLKAAIEGDTLGAYLADEAVAVLGVRDDGGGGAAALGVGHDGGRTTLHGGDLRVEGGDRGQSRIARMILSSENQSSAA